MDSWLNKMVKGVNAIIEEAVEHGGDAGGAYLTNHDGLRLAMETFIRALDIANYVEIVELNTVRADTFSDLHFRFKLGRKK